MKKTVRLKKYELKPDEKIYFIANSIKYGRAEFVVCPIIKGGALSEIYIYPEQQPDVKFYYHHKLDYKPLDFSVASWIHKGMGEPRIWVFFVCKEHKCLAFRLYVPLKAKSFCIGTGSNFAIQFDNE